MEAFFLLDGGFQLSARQGGLEGLFDDSRGKGRVDPGTRLRLLMIERVSECS